MNSVRPQSNLIKYICLPDSQHLHLVEKLKDRSASQRSIADRFSAYLIETFLQFRCV